MPAPAENRAHALLEACCTPEQWRAYESTRTIPVVGKATGLRYTIDGSIGSFNVVCQDGHAYCLLVDPMRAPRVPWEDTLATQKLLLESDEHAFRKIANRSMRIEEAAVALELRRFDVLELFLKVGLTASACFGASYLFYTLGNLVGLW